jgi:RsiW-degrading membrane proteinase PrsW (M82 family)
LSFAEPGITRAMRRIVLLVYVGVGLVIAATHHYFAHVNGWRGVVSAILAIFLWPLVLLKINLHIKA